jgi:hypothetical protein
MAVIKEFDIVCECCWMSINNGDDSGCKDYWEHTEVEHPRHVGTGNGEVMVSACGSEMGPCPGEEDDHTNWSLPAETCACCLGRIGPGAKYGHVAIFES